MGEALDATAPQTDTGAPDPPIGDPNELHFWLEAPEGKGLFPERIPDLTRLRILGLLGLEADLHIPDAVLLAPVKRSINRDDRLGPVSQRRARMYVAGYGDEILKSFEPLYVNALPILKIVLAEAGAIPLPKPGARPDLHVLPGGKTDRNQGGSPERESAGPETPPAESAVSQIILDLKPAKPRKAPGRSQLVRLFDGILDEVAVDKLQQLNAQERSAFLFYLGEVYKRNARQSVKVEQQMHKIDCLMRRMSPQQIGDELGISAGTLHSFAQSLQKIFAREPETVQLLVGNIEETIRNYKQAQANTPKPEEPSEAQNTNVLIETLVPSLQALLAKRGVGYEAITQLACHFAGAATKLPSKSHPAAILKLRAEIDIAVELVRKYRPEARQGRLTKEDAWLFSKLLGNPTADIAPRTLPTVYKHRERAEHLGEISYSDLQIRVLQAVQHLTTTLRSR